jgi:hypothetical protein
MPAGTAAVVVAAGGSNRDLGVRNESCCVSVESLAVPRVGVVSDSPCKVKGFTAQISDHTERRGDKAGDPGCPCDHLSSETSEPRREEQRKARDRKPQVVPRGVGREQRPHRDHCCETTQPDRDSDSDRGRLHDRGPQRHSDKPNDKCCSTDPTGNSAWPHLAARVLVDAVEGRWACRLAIRQRRGPWRRIRPPMPTMQLLDQRRIPHRARAAGTVRNPPRTAPNEWGSDCALVATGARRRLQRPRTPMSGLARLGLRSARLTPQRRLFPISLLSSRSTIAVNS